MEGKAGIGLPVMGDAEFIQYLQQHHKFYVEQMRGDGNCLYYSLASAFLQNRYRQMEVRYAVANYVRSNPQLFLNFADEELDYDTMINETTINHNFSYEFQLIAASEVYSSNIIVYTPDGCITSYPHNRRHQRNVYLSFHNGNHYNLLLEIVHSVNVVDPTADHILDLGMDGKLKMETDAEEMINNSCSIESGMKSDSEVGVKIYADGCDEENESDISTDVESEDDMEEDQPFDIDQDVIHEKGFNFLASKIFRCGRNFVYHIFLIPKVFAKETLSASITNVKGRAPLFHTICFHTPTYRSVVEDNDIQEIFVIWVAKKTFPIDQHNLSIRSWYSRFVIIYALLTAVRYRWRGETIKFLFMRKSLCLVPVLLNDWWQTCSKHIKPDMDTINANWDILICTNCNPKCQMKNYIWHINLRDFVINSVPATDHYLTFSSINNFRERELPPTQSSDVIVSLHKFYNETDGFILEEKMRILYNLLDENASHDYVFSCYILLVVDGEGMTSGVEFDDVVNDDHFLKALYVGQTQEDDFRHSHFNNEAKSPIPALITSTSKIFLLRSKKFNSRLDCCREEAMVQEILRLTLETAKQNKQKLPFILLNKRSENGHLLNLGKSVIKNIIEFCKLEIPIFVGSNDKSCHVKVKGSFKGYYTVKCELDIPYKSKTFSKTLYTNYM